MMNRRAFTPNGGTTLEISEPLGSSDWFRHELSGLPAIVLRRVELR